MSTGSVNLEECLCSLYDYSYNFHISIELIQKLSQQLKLETFIDKLNNDTQNSKRLTIAGSTILIDIDFLDDNKVTSLSLSSANQDENELKQENHLNDYTRQDFNITIDWSKNNVSFLKQKENIDDKSSIAEQIFLNNLKSDRLNRFPKNLQYLAKIDRLSSTNYNLFDFLEKITLLLKTINHLEGIGENFQDWQLNRGFSSFIGKVILNDTNTNELGLFIEYWQDFRFINHKYQDKLNEKNESNEKSTLNQLETSNESKEKSASNQLETSNESAILMGKNYKILITIDSAGSNNQINYFQQDTWNLSTGKYQINCPIPNNLLTNLQSWLVYANFNECIWLPTYLLKYFDWNYKIEKDVDQEQDEMYQNLNQSREIIKNFNNVEFKLIQELNLDKFLPIKSIELRKLSDLTTIIPILRNFLVLTNLITTSLKSDLTKEIDQLVDKPSSRRNSRVNPGELTEEARKKLKESLKLPNDVTDEELLGLNAINESANYSSIGSKQNDNLDLQTFMSESQPQVKPTRYIQFTIINFDFITNDIQLEIEGHLNENIYIPFTISNGQIMQKKPRSDQDMDIDQEITPDFLKLEKFIKGLNLTEDIYRIIKHIYN